MEKIFFMGLGTMGYPMAGHLKCKGYDITVYNRTNAVSEKWCSEYNGKLTLDPCAIAASSDFVFACVGNDADLKEITCAENGVLRHMQKGSVFVDHTTASASVERELYNFSKELEIGYVDAPVSGGEKGAQDGQLTIMCGGDEDVFDRVQSIMNSYSKKCILMGEIGNGQLSNRKVLDCCGGVNEQPLTDDLDLSFRFL